MAAFSAWLSRRIAPRTERSASRLFGKGFSRVVSAAMARSVAYSLFIRLNLTTLSLRVQVPSPTGHFDNLQSNRQAGLDQVLFDCLNRWRIVRAVAARVNRSDCAGL